jgi:hypothetical protein
MVGRPKLSFSFALVGEDGVLDQMMTLQYRGRTTAAPILSYQALDRQGHPLSEVTVHSCYGTDRGVLALTPGENTDLLVLRGGDAHLTADVAGQVVELRPLDRRENPVTQVIQQDERGNELPSGGGFHHLTVVNPWRPDALCHVVAVALDAPESGPQGAIEVVPLTPEPVVVTGNSGLTLTPPAEAYAAISRYFGSSFVTVKAFPAAG